MPEPMHQAEIKGHLIKLGMVAQVALQIPAAELLNQYSHWDAVGPMIDPTGWIALHDNSSKNQRALRALADFQKVIREVFPELETAGD